MTHPIPRLQLLALVIYSLAVFALIISNFFVQSTYPLVGADSPLWGFLANASKTGQPMKAVYFFAGSAKDHRFALPDAPAVPSNTQLFTVTPNDERHLRWSDSNENRSLALNMMADAGANVVVMSSWGEQTSDRWVYWAPMSTSTLAQDQLFDAASERGLFIMPVIESSDATITCGGSSAAYHFAADFPGSAEQPAPLLTAQIYALIDRYLLNPINPDWPNRWAQMYNRDGEARYAINLLHVASRQLNPGEHARFAAGFDAVADQIFRETGIAVGFTLDILPRPRVGIATSCGAHDLYFDSYLPTAAGVGPYLRGQRSLLAIQGFIPEIYLNTSDEPTLIKFKRSYIEDWIDQELPVILDISPGYDAHAVFPKSQRYGHNDDWRAQIETFYDIGCRGMVFNTWNGYTEGYAAVPTQQQGDANYLWLQRLFTRVDQDWYMQQAAEANSLSS